MFRDMSSPLHAKCVIRVCILVQGEVGQKLALKEGARDKASEGTAAPKKGARRAQQKNSEQANKRAKR